MKVQADKLEGQRGFIELPGDAIHSQGGPLNLLFLRIYREFRQPDNVSHLAIEGLFLELLAEISRQAKPLERKPAKWLMRAREYLDENFDYQLRLDAVAKSVGVHPVHLAREFRRHFKLTVGEYIRSRRVEHACRQLTKPDISIAEIAVMTGFSDQSHLSRAFKKIMGTTPADYRRERRWQRYEFDRTK